MKQIEQTIVDLVQKYQSMENRDSEEGQQIRAQLQLIGSTAAFFGGSGAMSQLHDAAEAIVGSDNSVGYYLNKIWDGIGGWWA